VGPKAGLDEVANEKVSPYCLFRDLNPCRSASSLAIVLPKLPRLLVNADKVLTRI